MISSIYKCTSALIDDFLYVLYINQCMYFSSFSLSVTEMNTFCLYFNKILIIILKTINMYKFYMECEQ